MSASITLATAARVLRQLRHDRRTLAMLVLVPCVLLSLLAWIYGTPVTCSTGSARRCSASSPSSSCSS